MLQWPDSCSFTFKPSRKKDKWKNGKETGNQLYDFVYEESFKKVDEKLMQRAMSLQDALKEQDIKLSRVGKRGLRITGSATREAVAGMIVGEFFNHSTIGSMKLGDLWQAASLGTAYVLKTEAEE